MNSINLAEVDLVRTICPPGTQIEIENVGAFSVDIPNLSLVAGIGHVYALLTREPVLVDDAFLQRVTLTGLDVEKFEVKVRIAGSAKPAPPYLGFSRL